VTLIELLVVIGIITALATLIVAVAPRFGERQRSSRGASMLQSWLNLAKQRAVRDQRPVGIRLPHIQGLPYVTEVSYIEVPDEAVGGTIQVPFDPNYPPVPYKTAAPAPYLAPATAYQFIKLVTTVQFDPTVPTAILQPGDVVTFPDKALAAYSLRRIADVRQPSTMVPLPSPPVPNSFVGANNTVFYNYFILLDQPLPSTPFTTQSHQFVRKARPVVGEPVLQLPKDIAIDIDFDVVNQPPTWSRMFPPLANTGGTGPFDILFSPAGQVIGYEGNLGSRICLWVRDVSLNTTGPYVNNDANRTDPTQLPPGDNTLITVYTRTGHVTAHPIDPSGLLPNSSSNPYSWDPFRFTQDGLSSGQ
jgi:type II secretory pathway pseudopilin PulG